MEVKKVLSLEQEEFEVLVKAGELVGRVNQMFESGEIDNTQVDVGKLINALAEVTTKVKDKIS